MASMYKKHKNNNWNSPFLKLSKSVIPVHNRALISIVKAKRKKMKTIQPYSSNNNSSSSHKKQSFSSQILFLLSSFPSISARYPMCKCAHADAVVAIWIHTQAKTETNSHTHIRHCSLIKALTASRREWTTANTIWGTCPVWGGWQKKDLSSFLARP